MKFTEKELIEEADKRLRQALGKVPFIEIGATRFEQPERFEQQENQPTLFRPDMMMQISTPDGPEALVVEVKNTITPKAAREASRELASMASMMPACYGVLVAPYISERTAEICKEAGVGYLDLAGNLGLFFNRVYLEVQGRPNRFRKEQELKSLFSPKSSRVIRVLLENPGRSWKLQDLAKVSELSTGMVSNIKSRLEDEDLLRKEPSGFKLTDPKRLLLKWSSKYNLRKNRWSDYYLAADVSEIESRIARGLDDLNQRYAFTLFSAANKIAAYSRYNRVFLYVDGDQSELMGRLGLKQVDSGPNITLLEPYDEGVFYGGKNKAGLSVVGMVQLYLDLVSYKGRGEEAARFLLDNELSKKWQKNI